MAADEPLEPDVAWYYERGRERERLLTIARLELLRTQELLERFLPAAPARVLDVGGGPGEYAAWLAARGYDVTLVEPVARDRALVARILEQSPRGRPQAVGRREVRQTDRQICRSNGTVLASVDEFRLVIQVVEKLTAPFIGRRGATVEGIGGVREPRRPNPAAPSQSSPLT